MQFHSLEEARLFVVLLLRRVPKGYVHRAVKREDPSRYLLKTFLLPVACPVCIFIFFVFR